jgi:hypothetical protein
MFREDVNTLRDMRFRHIRESRLAGPNSQLYEQHSIHVTTSVNSERKYVARPHLLIPIKDLILRHRTCHGARNLASSVYLNQYPIGYVDIYVFFTYNERTIKMPCLSLARLTSATTLQTPTTFNLLYDAVSQGV